MPSRILAPSKKRKIKIRATRHRITSKTDAERKKRNADRIHHAKSVVKKLATQPARNLDGTFKPVRASKYRSTRVVIDGLTFDSKAEAARWLQLVEMQDKGTISELERQVPYPCMVHGTLITTYRADFRYRINPGRLGQRTLIEDVKGPITAEYRIKKKLVQALHPIEIIELDVRKYHVHRFRYLTADQFHTAKDQPDDDQVRVAGGEDA